MNNIRQEISIRVASKYSSTLQNFHQIELTQLIDQQPSPILFLFQDLMDLSEDQEFMKRYYREEESQNKKILFGEYYSMLLDKPRVVNKDLEHLYEKWHYKKRNLVFREFEGDSRTVRNTSESDTYTNRDTETTKFLFNISTYNPSSQNYYLKKQPKKAQKGKKKVVVNDREGRSMESILSHLLDNSYTKKLTEISFTKKKKQPSRYYSIDNLQSQRRSENAIRITKKSVRVILDGRKSENLLTMKPVKNMKILDLRGHKVIQPNPEKQKTQDRIVKTLSTTNFTSVQASQRLFKKQSTSPNRLKPIQTQFSDKKFQTLKMPRLPLPNDQRLQKANKLLFLKLKC